MRITNSKGCSIADCPVDLGPDCTSDFCLASYMAYAHRIPSTGPDPLKGPLDASGFPLGCKSACLAGIGDSGKFRRLLTSLFDRCVDTSCTANNPNCCTGSFASPGTCQASGVAFYSYFSQCSLRSTGPCDIADHVDALIRGKLPERVRVRVRRGQRHGPTFL